MSARWPYTLEFIASNVRVTDKRNFQSTGVFKKGDVIKATRKGYEMLAFQPSPKAIVRSYVGAVDDKARAALKNEVPEIKEPEAKPKTKKPKTKNTKKPKNKNLPKEDLKDK